MQQIADLAGVSRGTVDRALNNRGRIRPEVAEKIKMIAKELGYQPNIAAKALSSGNQILRIGVILHYADTPTIQTVLEGAKDAKQEVERFGGRIKRVWQNKKRLRFISFRHGITQDFTD